MDRGDIYLYSRPTNPGSETVSVTAVMIVTPARFNKVTRLPVVLPIVSTETALRTAGFAVPLSGTGAVTAGVVRCDQPRTIDLSIYDSHRVERAPLTVVDEVMAKLHAIMTT